MSRGTVRPERSSHRRMVSADEACVVTKRIYGKKAGSVDMRRRAFSRCRSKTG